MLDLLKWIGFTVIFLRFALWVASSLTIAEKYWMRVCIAQAVDGIMLFFFFIQLFGNIAILPIHILYVRLFGFFLTCGGVAWAVLAKQQLGKAWVYASAYRIVSSHTLATTGVYKYIRHPLYTGIVASYVGIELLAGSWLFVSALFLLIPFYFQAKKEEKLLLKHFGVSYKKYQSKTKMLIPFVL